MACDQETEAKKQQRQEINEGQQQEINVRYVDEETDI